MPMARSNAVAGTAGSPVSPSTGCSPFSARWWNTRFTTVHGLNVSLAPSPCAMLIAFPRFARSALRASAATSIRSQARSCPEASAGHDTWSTGCRRMRRRPRLPRLATSERPRPYAAGVSSARAERLVNLVLCLLSTRQFLPAEKIRATVPGYADAATDEAFFRMFERDKTELRELGVPLETGRNSGFDTTDGYRIARHDYELGEIDLEPDEAAAVALAARLWETPGLAGAAHGAVRKLRAAGVEVDETGSGPVQPRVRAVEP